jgi:hypothetical protein
VHKHFHKVGISQACEVRGQLHQQYVSRATSSNVCRLVDLLKIEEGRYAMIGSLTVSTIKGSANNRRGGSATAVATQVMFRTFFLRRVL